MKRGWEWTLPGPWMTANKALGFKRSEGWYAGYGRALKKTGVEGVVSEYMAAARTVRKAVVDLVQESPGVHRDLPGRTSEQVWLVVHAVHPDARVDPDAAAIVSKWILDGLKDSGFITSEKEVIGTMHRTTQGPESQIYFSLQYPEEIIV